MEKEDHLDRLNMTEFNFMPNIAMDLMDWRADLSKFDIFEQGKPMTFDYIDLLI